MSDITPILMPKWGLSMKEGKLSAWHVSEGDEIKAGDEIMDVETDKIANVVEAADAGLLRRRIGTEGTTYPVRALLGVMAPETVSDAQIESYIEAYEAPAATDEDGGDEGPGYLFADLPIGRIRYAHRPGEGTPIVLVHGFGGDLDNWLFNIDALAQAGPVYALDLPGHGQSTKAARPANLDTLVRALAEFMESMDIPAAHFAGHSMGGLVAGAFSARHAEKVTSITLICPAGLGPEINPDYIDGFVQAPSRKELKPVLAHLFDNKSLVSRSMVEDLLKFKRLDGVQDFLTELSSTLFAGGRQAHQVDETLAGSAIPLLVIWGEADAIIPPVHADSLSRAVTHIVHGAGHMVQMEQSSEVNHLIIEFINSNSGK